jgi:two-component system, LuxR family, response regulator FixJ
VVAEIRKRTYGSVRTRRVGERRETPSLLAGLALLDGLGREAGQGCGEGGERLLFVAARSPPRNLGPLRGATPQGDGPYGGIGMTEQALVHVVDDDPGVRDSLVFLLQSAGHAVRAYDSAAAFLAVAPGLQTGCVLTDVRMPGMDGLALQQRIAALGGSLAVVVMTGHGDVPIAVAALKAGARDFLEKPFNDDRLLAVVREALDVSQRAQDAQAATAGIAVRLASLTPREREVLDGLVAGHPNKTIAYDLGTSPRTVEVQRARVMEKMGVRSLAELVRMVLAVQSPEGRAEGRPEGRPEGRTDGRAEEPTEGKATEP